MMRAQITRPVREREKGETFVLLKKGWMRYENVAKRYYLMGIAAAVFLTAATTANLHQAMADDTVKTGNCGPNAVWSLDTSTGVLTISGTGYMGEIKEDGNGKIVHETTPVEEWEYYQYREEVREVVFQEGITYIAQCAFGKREDTVSSDMTSEYPNLTKLTLPSTVEIIDDYAFSASGLEEISFSEGLREIGKSAFWVSSLSGAALELPQSLEVIGQSAFAYTSISAVRLHEGLTIGGVAFQNCDSLKEVTIPKDIIYKKAGTSNATRANACFSECDLLERVVIEGGGTVESQEKEIGIAESMFRNCPALRTVEIKAEDITYVGGKVYGAFDYENDITFWLYRGCNTEGIMRAAGYLTGDNVNYYDVDLTALEEAVAKAEAVDTSRYTEKSVKDLDNALESARRALERDNPLPSVLEKARTNLENAMAGLEELPTESPAPGNDGDAEATPEPGDDGDTEATPAPGDDGDAEATPGPDGDGNTEATPAPTGGDGNGSGGNGGGSTVTEVTVKKAAIKKITSPKKKTLAIQWKKVSGAAGYQIQVSTDKKFKKGVKKYTVRKAMTVKKTIKKLKRKKKYCVRIRAYKTVSGKNYYGSWSKTKQKKVK